MGEVAKPEGNLEAAMYVHPHPGLSVSEPMVHVVFSNNYVAMIGQEEIRDLIINRSVGKSTLATVLDMLKANASRDNIRRVIEAELGD